MSLLPDELPPGEDGEEGTIGWTLIGVGLTFIGFAVLCRIAELDRVAYVLFWIGGPVAAAGLAWELVTRPKQFLPSSWD